MGAVRLQPAILELQPTAEVLELHPWVEFLVGLGAAHTRNLWMYDNASATSNDNASASIYFILQRQRERELPHVPNFSIFSPTQKA